MKSVRSTGGRQIIVVIVRNRRGLLTPFIGLVQYVVKNGDSPRAGSLRAGVQGRAGVLAGSHAAAPALRLPTRPGCEAGNTSGRPWAAGLGRSVAGGGSSVR